MRRSVLYFSFLFLLCFSFSACGSRAVPTESTPVSTTAATGAESEPQTTFPPEPPETTLPLHSELYIPGVSVEDVILYFDEVCLNAEFVNSGDPTLLQKWTDPIFYHIHGELTEADQAVLTAFADSLNTLPGFPGIYQSQDALLTNLSIFFCDQQYMLELMGDQFLGMDGGVTFWYNDENVIYDAIICCRTDLTQQLRNSVILEEIYNGLGPIQDTSFREDSIIYSELSEPQQLTGIDWLLLKLLYHPDMKCGMTAAQCEAVIRQLYY